MPQEYVSIEMTMKQPLAFFLPMKVHGQKACSMKQVEGVCSIALVTYLARLQNNFIDLSWEKLKLKSM